MFGITIDHLTKQAIMHTRHCLTGCATGEILGMAIASSLHWHRLERVVLATVLAFFFGYLLTFRGARKANMSPRDAFRLAMAVDTVSILSMEVIDNAIEFLIPGALSVTIAAPRFWWSLALALTIAFIVTVPVNRLMMAKGIGHSGHHH